MFIALRAPKTIAITLVVVLALLGSAKGARETQAFSADIGIRTEKPGAFLSWPLADINQDNITRFPDTPWTHHFLGISRCGDYPSLLDSGYWYNGSYYPGNRNLILPGTSDAQVKWMNNGDGGVWDNAFACYAGHEGIDISQADGTHVLAAASGYIHAISGSRYTIRHANINNTGQTWYTTYVHVTNMRYSIGTYVERGTWIANVGSGHLHLEVLYNGIYSSNARNPYGIDLAPYDDCLWLDQNLCPPTLYDYNHDTVPDLWAINKQGLGTNSTELHIISGANPQQFLANLGTVLHHTDNQWDFAVADYNRDGAPDLWAINKQGLGTNSTELHIISGANPQQFLLNMGTVLHRTDETFVFLVADYNRDGIPDLWAINKQGLGTNSTELHIISGANPQQFLLNTGTVLHHTDNQWDFVTVDYNHDGVPDLWAINKQGLGTNSTEVHIISGANPQQFLANLGTVLHRTDNQWEFAVANYNRDAVPDLWAINKQGLGTNSTELHIISGANPQQFLANTNTVLHRTDSNWCFSGGSCLGTGNTLRSYLPFISFGP